MEPKCVSRDEFLKDLVKIINDVYPNFYFVPKKQKDERNLIEE